MKIKKVVIIVIRDQGDIELFTENMKSPDSVKLLLNETKEELMNMLGMVKDLKQCSLLLKIAKRPRH